MGKIILTDEQKKTIERCAGLGLTLDDISHIISVSPKTLDRRLKDDETVRSHYEKGRAIAKMRVTERLHELIENGEISAIFFYLKCQCGWREKQEIQAEITTPTVQIYLPKKNE